MISFLFYLTTITFGKNKFKKWHFSSMFPWLLQQENLFCISHHKTNWTIIADNICLIISLLGTSCSMLTLVLFFPWCRLRWSWDKFNNQSQNWRESRDNFMVHNVNNPLANKLRSLHEGCRIMLLYHLNWNYAYIHTLMRKHTRAHTHTLDTWKKYNMYGLPSVKEAQAFFHFQAKRKWVYLSYIISF